MKIVSRDIYIEFLNKTPFQKIHNSDSRLLATQKTTTLASAVMIFQRNFILASNVVALPLAIVRIKNTITELTHFSKNVSFNSGLVEKLSIQWWFTNLYDDERHCNNFRQLYEITLKNWGSRSSCHALLLKFH